jgi:hypothetical protein
VNQQADLKVKSRVLANPQHRLVRKIAREKSRLLLPERVIFKNLPSIQHFE